MTDPRQLTLTEATALQLAALAALDDVRAELGSATMRELRAASAKLNEAIEVLAGQAPPALARAARRVRSGAGIAAGASALPPPKERKQKRNESKQSRRPPEPHPRRTVVGRKRHTR